MAAVMMATGTPSAIPSLRSRSRSWGPFITGITRSRTMRDGRRDAEVGERLLAVHGDVDGVALESEEVGDPLADAGVVLYDEDGPSSGRRSGDTGGSGGAGGRHAPQATSRTDPYWAGVSPAYRASA